MKILFICWRPLQIFNTIIFIYNNDVISNSSLDMIIIDEFKSLDMLFKKIKSINIFNDITVVPSDTKNPYTRLIYNILPRFYIYHKLKKKPYTDYDIIVATGWHMFFRNYARIMPRAKVIFLDDGVGSYLGDIRDREFTTLKNKIFKLFKYDSWSINISQLFLLNPELCANIQFTEVKKLANIINGNLISTLDNVFNYSFSDTYKNHKFIFCGVDTPPVFTDGMSLLQILNTIHSNLNNDTKLLYRSHPASRLCCTMGEDLCDIDRANDLWELICLHCISDNHVIISIFSTTAFMPKIIANANPNLIFLFNMVDHISEETKSSYVKLVNQFECKYPKGKIFMPASCLELSDVITGLEIKAGKF